MEIPSKFSLIYKQVAYLTKQIKQDAGHLLDQIKETLPEKTALFLKNIRAPVSELAEKGGAKVDKFVDIVIGSLQDKWQALRKNPLPTDKSREQGQFRDHIKARMEKVQASAQEEPPPLAKIENPVAAPDPVHDLEKKEHTENQADKQVAQQAQHSEMQLLTPEQIEALTPAQKDQYLKELFKAQAKSKAKMALLNATLASLQLANILINEPSAENLSSWLAIMKKSNFELADIKKLWNLVSEDRTCANYLLIGIAKEVAHEWGLQGETTINQLTLRLTGHLASVMHANLAASVAEYLTVRSANKSPEGLNKDDAGAIVKCLKQSVAYSHDLFSNGDSAFTDYQKGELVTFNAGWPRHGVEVTLYKNSKGDTYLAYTNRGNRLEREVLEDSQDKMRIYRIQGELTLEKLTEIGDHCMENPERRQKLAEKLHKVVDELTEEDIVKERMEFLEGGGLAQSLDLELVGRIEKSEQKVGNCSWANAKGGFHACVLLKMMEHAQVEEGMTPEDALKHVTGQATALFKDWEIDFRRKQIEFFLSLEPAVKNGEVDMTLEDYYSLVALLCYKLEEKGKFDRYQDKEAFPNDTVRENIGRIQKTVQEFLQNHPFPLKYFTVDVYNEQLKGSQPGSSIIVGKELYYVDAKGNIRQQKIPDNCASTHDLHQLILELQLPVQITQIRSYGISDQEMFSTLKGENKGFDTAEAAAQHLQEQPKGAYAIFPSAKRAGKYCVQYKLPNGKLSTPTILEPSTVAKKFALERFAAMPYANYYGLVGLIAKNRKDAERKLSDKTAGSYVISHKTLYFKHDDGSIDKIRTNTIATSPQQLENLVHMLVKRERNAR